MANPLLKNDFFTDRQAGQETMTLSGTINKSIILWIFLAAGAFYSWTHPQVVLPFLYPLIFIGFILALVNIFKKSISPFLSPVYAFSEGLILGVLSLYFEKSYPGIVVNAILLTVCVLFCMLAAYRSGLLRATPLFIKIVVFSTLAIALVYLLDIGLNVFASASVPYLHDSSLIGIGISLFIVAIASFNLIIDFDLIEKASMSGAPKYMEWYCSFALMITLVWLYLEILRLLGKIRN
ncbi:MAG: Bax inhibitor-1/YccA family protein [Endomicrobium sp.]|jgi:uncharacterized YccA/Bax inhibitor family protein|nr:Bax inhibitor-1/YccA family protein [Endomicrobium sp.]